MKYIKQLNINFNNWEEINGLNINDLDINNDIEYALHVKKTNNIEYYRNIYSIFLKNSENIIYELSDKNCDYNCIFNKFIYSFTPLNRFIKNINTDSFYIYFHTNMLKSDFKTISHIFGWDKYVNKEKYYVIELI